MEKIIYCDAMCMPEQKKRPWQWLWNILLLPYPIVEKEGQFLGYPVEKYVIEGLSVADAAWLQSESAAAGRQSESAPPGQSQGGRRFSKTLKKLQNILQKKEMQREPGGTWDAFLFCTWEKPDYPLELMLRFYEGCRAENENAYRAQQLIFLEAEREGSAFLESSHEKEMTFVSEICGTYNYATVVTENREQWEAAVTYAYEEYGLFIRCVPDDGRLCFREKKTLIIDMGSAGRKCCRNFPKDSVYLDFYEAEEKRRVISVKCREIPYLSVHNALDTALEDTV